jgi:SOS response regulatory protein OraA/RecX
MNIFEKLRIMNKKAKRTDHIKLAIHDHGTRDGATPKKVMAALLKEGFQKDEIEKAITDWLGQ